MSSEQYYKSLTKMTEGELRIELFDLIRHLIGDANAHKMDGEVTSKIKSLMKAYANAALKRVRQDMTDLKNQLQDRMKGDGKLQTGKNIKYPKCPFCKADVFGQAYAGADLKEITLYCSNAECPNEYKVRFVDLKRKVV